MEHITTAEIEQQVLDAMRRAGCEPAGDSSLVLDGQLHRYRVHGDKNSETSGAYCIHTDNWPAGWFMDWHSGEAITWKFNGEGRFSRDFFDSKEYKEMCRISDEHQKKLKAEREAAQKAAILKAREEWDKSVPIDSNDFPYLKNKNVGAHGCRVRLDFNAIMYGGDKEGQLVIPLRNIKGEIQTLQFIDANGNKRFLANAPVKGAFFSIGLDDKFLALHPEAPILIAEGFATAATVFECTGYPTVAAMNAGNLYPVSEAIRDRYPDRKIIIMADFDAHKDGTNTGMEKAQTAKDKLGLQGVICPPFSKEDARVASDWNDYEGLYGSTETAQAISKLIRWTMLPVKVKEITKKVGVVNVQDLRTKKFNPVNWAIDGFMPSGLTILGGGPKVGKSMLALHLGLGVASGGCVLGKINVEAGDVLYLALEDTERRLQERILGSGIPDDVDLSRMDIVTSIPRQDEGGMDFLRYWLGEHPGAKLVIVDTLQRFRRQTKSNRNVYAEDYECMTELKKLADEFNVAVLVTHHLKKMSKAEEIAGDWITHLSGSMGLSGAADTILLLKRERVSTHGTLLRTGRDVEEKEFQMKLDGFGWYLEDDAEEFSMPSWKKIIYNYLKSHEKITPMLLSEAAHITIEGAKKQLQRAANDGLIKRLELGVYILS